MANEEYTFQSQQDYSLVHMQPHTASKQQQQLNLTATGI